MPNKTQIICMSDNQEFKVAVGGQSFFGTKRDIVEEATKSLSWDREKGIGDLYEILQNGHWSESIEEEFWKSCSAPALP